MQKITSKKNHKSLPTFSLHSTRSFKIFQKNYPKHLHKLDIDYRIGPCLESDQTKKILMNVIKLAKKTPKVKTIQYINLSKFLNARVSQALSVIKAFQRVQSVGVIWDFCDLKTQEETRKWLKYAYKLQSLTWRQTEKEWSAGSALQAKGLNIELARDLQRSKIKKIIHSILPSKSHIKDLYILNMNTYPSTTQELSLDLSKCDFLTDGRKAMSQLFSMQNFSLLTRLELLFPLEMGKVFKILKTVPNPHLLTSLGLYLVNSSPMHSEQDLSQILNFIAGCPELEKLYLRMTNLTNKIGLLSRLSSPDKLKVLNLWGLVKLDKHLQDLGTVILSTINLECLDFTVDFSSDSIQKEIFLDLYKGISQLKKLQKLSLNFTSKIKRRITPVSSDLVRCLGDLSQLEELSLHILDVNLYLEFSSVLEGLKKIAHQLKKFSTSFMGSDFDEKDELELINVLRKMKELRELEIERLSFNQSQKGLLKFRSVLEGYKSLKKITWKDFEPPKEGDETFFEMVTSALAKKGVEEVRFIQNQTRYSYESKKEILFGEILKRNPELMAAEINSEVVSSDFYHSPFEVYKYAD